MFQLKKKQKKVAELEEKNYYGNLMLVTKTERLYDFNKYRKSSILFDEIRKGKIKLNEASDFQNKFKLGLSHIKRVLKSEEIFL